MSRLTAKTLISLLIFVMGLSLLNGCCLFPRERPYQREVRTMLVTAYDAGKESCGWKRKYGCIGPPVYAYGPLKGKRKLVGITADGTKAKKGTIAADIRKYPFGTKMYVPGYGWGEVHDVGSAIKGDHIDVFFPSHKDAMKWGKKYLKVIILRRQ
jgi:3D (Asp-Asp-Asp) domain-containing protein